MNKVQITQKVNKWTTSQSYSRDLIGITIVPNTKFEVGLLHSKEAIEHCINNWPSFKEEEVYTEYAQGILKASILVSS